MYITWVEKVLKIKMRMKQLFGSWRRPVIFILFYYFSHCLENLPPLKKVNRSVDPCIIQTMDFNRSMLKKYPYVLAAGIVN